MLGSQLLLYLLLGKYIPNVGQNIWGRVDLIQSIQHGLQPLHIHSIQQGLQPLDLHSIQHALQPLDINSKQHDCGLQPLAVHAIHTEHTAWTPDSGHT
jgi:hypothetical protein